MTSATCSSSLFTRMQMTKVFPAYLAALLLVVSLLLVLRNLPPYRFGSSLETTKILDTKATNGTSLAVDNEILDAKATNGTSLAKNGTSLAVDNEILDAKATNGTSLAVDNEILDAKATNGTSLAVDNEILDAKATNSTSPAVDNEILDAKAKNGTSLGVGEQDGVYKHNDKPTEKLHDGEQDGVSKHNDNPNEKLHTGEQDGVSKHNDSKHNGKPYENLRGGEQDGLSKQNDKTNEKLQGGLIAPGFDKNSCLSRYQSAFYRKNSPHKPSSYLISKLRIYEKLHRRCGPHTKSYNRAVEQLKSTKAKKRKKHLKSGHSVSSSECKYIVWISNSGLGNRILSIASAFLYALLTNRVFLVDPGNTMDDLFCEPFPENSWFLPIDCPLKNQIHRFNKKTPHSFGNLLKTNTSMSSHVYLYLANDYDDHDKLFFRYEYHSLIEKVPWLTMLSNQYFVPSLFLSPSFEPELSRLFPEKETVFHHLGRYLFHPTNQVWGLITSYYQAYLAKADERIGIQVRTFHSEPGTLKLIKDQILACTYKENLLPKVDKNSSMKTPVGKPKHKVVLITTLTPGYYETLKDLYWKKPTVSGDIIDVYQPSQEGHQQTENTFHNRKAWAEMYLLSLCDVLVTTAWSTFGYVAQGLGGLKPWILYRSNGRTMPNPPCGRDMSMEPCFHFPPFYDYEAKRVADTGALVPYVRRCVDRRNGVKLIDSHDEL